MGFLRHLLPLLRELAGFAWRRKVWWIVPLVIVFLVLSLLVVIGQSSAPFIYSLF
jgi:hypothetical protein